MDANQLQELIEQATVDCYGEHEEFWGFLAALEDELQFPFTATVLGDRLKVIGINSERSGERKGIMIAVEKRGSSYAFPLSELDVNDLDGDNGAWVQAYLLWSRH